MNQILFFTSLIPLLLYIPYKTKKSLHILQQNWYDDDHRYLKWIIENPKKVFWNMDFFIILIPFLYQWIDSTILTILVFLFFSIAFYIERRKQKKEQVKKPLVYTNRVKRLMITILFLYILEIIGISLYYSKSLTKYYYVLIGSSVYLNAFIVMIANIINIPIEKMVFLKYKAKAIRKLKNMNHLSVIGVTGSYGKTSSKNIISDVLNRSFNATPTPKNFNTPYGLIQTINNHLDKFTDLFIAEMGAFKRGEIKELCNLVKPKYGILTTIGTAHLESFGSRENIQKGKFELIESLPKNGIGILNMDDPYQTSYQLKNNCPIIWIAIQNKKADVYADNIQLSDKGTTFDCHFKNDPNAYPFTLKLLGKANIYNALAAIALGKALGMNIEELQLGVKKVEPIEHRLEIKQYGKIHLIDDAYNSNPVGSSMAVEVLGYMPGKKIIVTPGMIELGEEQYTSNKEFGKQIAQVCDEVILIGEIQTKPIYDGLMEKNYDQKHIHILNDVKLAFPLVEQLQAEETYVLLENDLPDIFNESIRR